MHASDKDSPVFSRKNGAKALVYYEYNHMRRCARTVVRAQCRPSGNALACALRSAPYQIKRKATVTFWL